MSKAPARKIMRAALLLGKIAVTVSLLGYIYWHNRDGLTLIPGFATGPVLIAIVLTVLQIVLACWRWHAILAQLGHKVSGRDLFLVFYTATFVSQITPVGGDVVRAMFFRRFQVPLLTFSVSVIADRLGALAALFLIVLAGLPWLFGIDGSGEIATTAGLIAGLGPLGFASYPLVASIVKHGSVARFVPDLLHQCIAMLGLLMRTANLVLVLSISIAVHLVSVIIFYLIAAAFGIPISAWVMLIVAPVILFAQVIPLSVGGWGVREAAAIVLFGLVGISSNDGFGISVGFGLLTIVATLPGSLSWLALRALPTKAANA